VKMRLDGVAQVEVAKSLGVSTRIVRAWERRYRLGGWTALAKRRRGRSGAE